MKIYRTSGFLSYPKVCQNIPPLNIFSSQSNLSISLILISLKVSKWYLKHPMFEPFRSYLLEDKFRLNVCMWIILHACNHICNCQLCWALVNDVRSSLHVCAHAQAKSSALNWSVCMCVHMHKLNPLSNGQVRFPHICKTLCYLALIKL